MSFFKTALVVCLFLLTLTASPIHNIPEIDFVPTDVSQSLLGSESQFGTSKADKKLHEEATGLGLMTISPPTRRRNLQSRTLPAKPTTPLRPRSPSPPISPGIRVTSFIRTAALVPAALAAEKLEDFYTIIALKVETGQLANLPPSKLVVCSLWDFELSFSCDKIDVPLSFVQAFAIDMAEWSSRQFTGFYDATVRGEGPLSGLVFYVQMRLKGKGQQSPYFR